MAMMQWDAHADQAWQAFGAVSLLLLVLIWPAYRERIPDTKTAAMPVRRTQWDADKLRLVLCYGAFGFGYIIPATFLPAMAHQYISNPAMFGWAWPVFGAAAALSTYAVSHWLHAANIRKLRAFSYLLMAPGVVLPVVWPRPPRARVCRRAVDRGVGAGVGRSGVVAFSAVMLEAGSASLTHSDE